jgi:transglutaminase-like putative cysteine protease
LVQFSTEINAGQEPIVTRGDVRDGQLVFETTTTGEPVASAISWPAGAGGFKATEHSLSRQPMQPGERRKLAGLMVGFNQLAEIEMTAGAAFEPMTLLDHSEDLLRIDWTATLPKGNVIRSVWWANHAGEVLKMQLDALHQATYRTTREIALADRGPMRFDLLRSTIVPVDRPLEHAARTRRARYRVRLETEDPSQVFAAGGTQQVTPVDPHTAEISVQAVRPNDKATATVSSGATIATERQRPPTDEDRLSNNLIESDAPTITVLAKQAAAGATDPTETAIALERFVHDYITGNNYLKAFSTAVEVAQSREGSCTQHAVLLAALSRARGIPARVAIGLVYLEDCPGFAFHAWNEVWIGDHWIALDATRGGGGISAAYLKLSDSSLQGEAAYSCFLPVSQVIGQAKIEILEAE